MPCPDTKVGQRGVSLASTDSSESVEMWNRGVQTPMTEMKDQSTQTEETALGLKSYQKAQL
eukprot:5441181-Karenia_brevis.AAC.1